MNTKNLIIAGAIAATGLMSIGAMATTTTTLNITYDQPSASDIQKTVQNTTKDSSGTITVKSWATMNLATEEDNDKFDTLTTTLTGQDIEGQFTLIDKSLLYINASEDVNGTQHLKFIDNSDTEDQWQKCTFNNGTNEMDVKNGEEVDVNCTLN